MKGIGEAAVGALLGSLLLVGISGYAPRAMAQAQQQKQDYTRDEYDAYMKAHQDSDPQQKIKDLDDFVAKYGKSKLLVYVYNDYYQTYYNLKDYPKTIEYIDKLMALGDAIDPTAQLQLRLARSQTFLLCGNLPACNTPEQLNTARTQAQQGLKDLSGFQKPARMSDADFDKFKKDSTGVFDNVIATTDYALKDWNAAADAYKTLVALVPDDAAAWSRLGIALLQENPPQTLDGYWALAHAISLKPSNAPQLNGYLKTQLSNYQQLGCSNLVDDELNQMTTLAATTPDRPSTFTLPSTDDLTKVRNDTADFIPWLREGGDHGKLMWLATCGLDYPEVVSKVISVDAPAETGPVVLHLCLGATPDETQNCKTPDMEVKVPDQPDAKRVQPDDALRFEATLVGYDQNPFMLHWDKGKVNPEDIPEPGKPKPKKKGTEK